MREGRLFGGLYLLGTEPTLLVIQDNFSDASFIGRARRVLDWARRGVPGITLKRLECSKQALLE